MKKRCPRWSEIKSNKEKKTNKKRSRSKFVRNKAFNILVFYVQVMMLIWQYKRNMFWKMKHAVIFTQTILTLRLSRSCIKIFSFELTETHLKLLVKKLTCGLKFKESRHICT